MFLLCNTFSLSSPLSLHAHQQPIWAIFESHASRQNAVFAQAQQGGDGVLDSNEQPPKPSAVMGAFERAAAYKKSLSRGGDGSSSPPNEDGSAKVEPNSSGFDLRARAEEGSSADAGDGLNDQTHSQDSAMAGALAEKEEARREDGSSQGVEVEIITRDGVIRRRVSKTGEAFSMARGPARKGISSSDFMGLDFSEKKSKGGLPAGLAAGFEPPPPGSLPEVQIITRDGANQQSSKDGLYKPKVVTWGVFERPADISQAYGGGRTIKPGERLETEEEKQARNARTKDLLALYYKKVGLDVDPQIKEECAKTLKQGNDMFEKGYLQGATEKFKQVMQGMPYQSELHGLAALQMALCFDSSNRLKEAKELYEKVASHPNATVRKKAKQFLYGFQAMEDLKVSMTSQWDTSGYRKYFDAFSDGYNNMYKPSEEEVDEGRMKQQAFLYIGVLAFPLILLLIVIALKGS